MSFPNRIQVLKTEIETLEKKQSTQIFMKLLNQDKLDSINEQLEIIKKQLEIINILLEKEWTNKKIEEITGTSSEIDDRQKELIKLIKDNEHKISPTILNLYDWSNKATESDETKDVKEEKVEEKDVKVNIESYLDMENDSDYENEIIEKLRSLDITKETIDIKPNVPVVVPQPKREESSSSSLNWVKDQNWKDSMITDDNEWRAEEAEQSNPRRKYIDRRQYFVRKDNPISMKYTPYDKEPQALNPTGVYLDLDCVEDKEKMITLWIKENGAVANKEGMSKEQTIEFMRRTIRGNAERYLESAKEVYEGIKNSSATSSIFISNLEKLLRREFLGQAIEKGIEEKWEIERQQATRDMINIAICDMCYFDQYTCEYSELFYKARLSKQADYNFYSQLYYEKLPEPFKSKLIEDFKKHGIDNPTFGSRIWFAQRMITEYCLQARNQKQIYKYQKRSLCCPKNTHVGQYGCYNRKYKRKGKQWKFRKSKNRFKTGERPYKRNFRRKRFNRNYANRSTKNNKSVKRCTCFLCKEEGHYANQCPKRNNHNIKILETIENYGFEPIESDIESDYSIYSASINSDYSSEDE